MRAIPTLKISISGVRGVIGDSLNPILLTRFAQAFGTYLGAGTIIIGRDPRTSGEMVRQAVIAGLISTGCRIIDIGVCPVPTVQLMVRKLRARGGIAITASHNPPEWNALKFIGGDGLFLSPGSAHELLDIYHQGEYTKVSGAEMRSLETFDGALDLHIKEIIETLGKIPTRDKKLRVALDSCNGAASIIAPRLLEELGVEVFPINITPNGLFPREAEPTAENLTDLSNAVREHQADIGFAQDMDADRLAVVSNTGEPIGEDYTLVLATNYILSHEPGAVVTNLSTTDVMDSVVGKFGSTLYRSKIGEAHVTEMMRREKAVIGGEGNGGVIYPRINFCRDSQVGMAIILHLLAERNQPLTKILNDFPRLVLIKEKLPCPSHKIAGVLRLIRETFADSKMNLTDGVKIIFPDGWLHVRGSNTEPIIRVSAEAKNETRVHEIIDSVFQMVREFVSEDSANAKAQETK